MGTTFCEGYSYGWRLKWKTHKGEYFDPPPAPPCPDPRQYRHQDNFGGQIAGILDATKRINDEKK